MAKSLRDKSYSSRKFLKSQISYMSFNATGENEILANVFGCTVVQTEIVVAMVAQA